MRRTPALLAALGLVLVSSPLAALQAPDPLEPQPDLINQNGLLFTLQQVASGLSNPLFVTHAGDGSGRIFIVQQGGAILQQLGGVTSTYLNVASKITCCGERGLLGLAFHPNFENNGVLFISYTGPNGLLTVEKLTASPPSTGLPSPNGQIIITQVHNQFGNHNGGGIGFGPDGYLYIAWGDGGGGGDPLNSGQNLNTLLGKMLRIDVDNPANGLPYGIPAGNPFAAGGGRAEIWAYGLRNPWRWSFDRATGDLWIADVGQNVNEEVNFQAAGAAGGRNYGWNDWEGHLPYLQGWSGLPVTGVTYPVWEYFHLPHCSVTGGYAYRGPVQSPLLQGMYLYGDYCSGWIWGLVRVPIPGVDLFVSIPLMDSPHSISSFGEDEAGNVYVIHHNNGNGAVYRIA